MNSLYYLFLILCMCAYHSRQIWGRGHSSHAGGADTCQALSGGAPPHCCSPCRQRATLQSDSSPKRRSARRTVNYWTWGGPRCRPPKSACELMLSISCVSELYLWCEVMLLQLSTLPQIPGPNGVVKTSCPKLSAVVGYVNTASAVRVTLELPTSKVKRQKNIYWHLLFKITHTAAILLWGLKPKWHEHVSPSHLTRVWLCRSQTAMFPSLQHEKQTLASGLMAKA